MAARVSTVAGATVVARLSTMVDAIVADTPLAAVTLMVSPVMSAIVANSVTAAVFLECLLWGLLH